MNFYLSSFKLGSEIEKLKQLIVKTQGNFAYIPNARDFTTHDPDKRKKHIETDMIDFGHYCNSLELLDLKEYFYKHEILQKKIYSLDGIYVSGGNVFVLRQAMKLSGLDKIIQELPTNINFLYVGYSAGVCVLSPSLKQYAIVDNSNDYPYSQIKETIWNGLGILDFAFEPHYRSDHPESACVEKEVKYCIENKILFKTYKDGEVLIIDK